MTRAVESTVEDRVKALLAPHAQYEAGLKRLLKIVQASPPASSLPANDSEIDEDDHALDFSTDSEPDLDLDEDVSPSGDKSLLIIQGAPGTGKSRLLETLDTMEGFKSEKGRYGDKRPVVRINVPEDPTPKSVIAELCGELRLPIPKKATRRELLSLLRTQLPKFGVRVLELDEAHVFADEVTEKKLKINARFLKFLSIHSPVPIVLAGEEPLKALLSYPALFRRMYPPIQLHPYGWGLRTDVAEFRVLIKHIEKAVQMPEMSEPRLTDLDIASRLHFASRGIVGLLGKLFIEAADIARNEAADCLSCEHFAKAWDDWQKVEVFVTDDPLKIIEMDQQDLNPFRCDLEEFKKLWKARLNEAALNAADTSGSTGRGKRAPKQPKLTGFRS